MGKNNVVFTTDFLRRAFSAIALFQAYLSLLKGKIIYQRTSMQGNYIICRPLPFEKLQILSVCSLTVLFEISCEFTQLSGPN